MGSRPIAIAPLARRPLSRGLWRVGIALGGAARIALGAFASLRLAACRRFAGALARGGTLAGGGPGARLATGPATRLWRSLGGPPLGGDPSARATGAARGTLTLAGDRGLTVRADRPLGVDGAAAGAAGILEAGPTLRTGEPVALGRVLTTRAGRLGQTPQTQLRCPRLQLPLANVLEELRRAQDRVDHRSDERNQRGHRRRPHQHRILDPPLGVGVGPVDQRQVDHRQEQDQQIQREVDRVVVDPEQGKQGRGHAPESLNRWRPRMARPAA